MKSSNSLLYTYIATNKQIVGLWILRHDSIWIDNSRASFYSIRRLQWIFVGRVSACLALSDFRTIRSFQFNNLKRDIEFMTDQYQLRRPLYNLFWRNTNHFYMMFNKITCIDSKYLKTYRPKMKIVYFYEYLKLYGVLTVSLTFDIF